MGSDEWQKKDLEQDDAYHQSGHLTINSALFLQHNGKLPL